MYNSTDKNKSKYKNWPVVCCSSRTPITQWHYRKQFLFRCGSQSQRTWRYDPVAYSISAGLRSEGCLLILMYVSDTFLLLLFTQSSDVHSEALCTHSTVSWHPAKWTRWLHCVIKRSSLMTYTSLLLHTHNKNNLWSSSTVLHILLGGIKPEWIPHLSFHAVRLEEHRLLVSAPGISRRQNAKQERGESEASKNWNHQRQVW